MLICWGLSSKTTCFPIRDSSKTIAADLRIIGNDGIADNASIQFAVHDRSPHAVQLHIY